MHIRPRPWARPELFACGFFIDDPRSQKGNWAKAFEKQQPLHLELGCGKGHFLAGIGTRNPQINYLGIDMIDAMLGLSKRNIEAAYSGEKPQNILLTGWDITRLSEILDPHDGPERIYINFCNPWPKRKYHKKRMTHPRQLIQYEQLLKPGSELHFKTDCDYLFEASLNYFSKEDWAIVTLIEDLHKEPDPDSILTEHEMMFMEKGVSIKKVIVRTPAHSLR